MLASRLRTARKLAGLSARSLSGLAGLSPTHVALIESGGRDVGSQTAAALAEVLGITLDWLIAGDGVLPSEVDVKRAVEAARAKSPSSSAA